LKARLATRLPGPEAHARMSSSLRTGGGPDARGALPRWKPNARTRQSAVLIALYPDRASLRFPLIQRPTYAGVHSAQIALPGGRREPADATLIDTALREADEEVGIHPASVTVLGTLSELFVGASNHLVLPVVGTLPRRPDFRLQAEEVDAVIEASVEELARPDRQKVTDLRVRGVDLRAPYFDVDGRVVWGATAMMLSEFLWLWEEAQME
ncbi:MAG: CoA pyrophosphatase, partial [Catalinimonas sp.]